MSERSAPDDFGLKRNEKLKSAKAIEALFNGGKFIGHGNLILKYRIRPINPSENPIKMGVAVSAKKFKKSVDRNYVKRILREAFRHKKPLFRNLLQNETSALDMMFIYNNKERPEYLHTLSEMEGLVKRLERKFNRHEEA